MQARDGRDRVVEAAQQVGAQVEPGVGGDRVREAEAGEARRRCGIQDVADERQRGADDQRRAEERKRVRAAAVHPGECSRRAREMQDDVEEAEERGHAGKRGARSSARPARRRGGGGARAPTMSCGVRASCHPVLAAEAADELVGAVEGGERCELDPTRVGPVGEGADAGEGHSRRLTGRKGPNHAAGQCLGVRQPVPADGCPRDAREKVFDACHGACSIRSPRSGRYPASP